MNKNDSSMPQVYGVFAQEMDYYDSLELVKLFGDKANAETFAQELREMMGEPLFDGGVDEPRFALVKVKACSVH